MNGSAGASRIDDARRPNAFGLLMSMRMRIETPGGFDYIGAQCRACTKEVGFAHTPVEPPLIGPDLIVITTA
jgi:hypothetical protein